MTTNSFTPEDVDALVSWLEVTATVAGGYYHPQAPAAANLIRRLVALIKVKDEALAPFAEKMGCVHEELDDDYSPDWAAFFTYGDFRRAQAAREAAIEGDGE